MVQAGKHKDLKLWTVCVGDWSQGQLKKKISKNQKMKQS